MGTYREHEWHVMELPALTSPAAIRFTHAVPRAVSVYIVPGYYPSVPTLGDESSPNAGMSKTVQTREAKEQGIVEAMVAYLLVHGMATIKTLTKAVRRDKSNVHAALSRHAECFERTGETAKHGAELWRLKRGVA